VRKVISPQRRIFHPPALGCYKFAIDTPLIRLFEWVVFVPFFRTRNRSRRLHCTWRTLSFFVIVNREAGNYWQPKVISIIVTTEYEYEYRLTPEYEYDLTTEQNLRKAKSGATPMF